MKRRMESTTRREFLAAVGAATTIAVAGRGLSAQVSPGQRLAVDPRRPQFHLLPAMNWMNDPNGPVYFNGSYHMFFQYNPHGATWGDMSWNHAISKDMIHWRHLQVAMTPTPDSPDSFGVFSGSAITMGKRVYMIYTGTVASTPELATLRDGHSNLLESQCLAYSDDADLIHWTKLPRPVVPTPPAGMKVTGFRDPSIWKQGEWYYMTVGSGEVHVGGCVLLYRSKDLRNWEYLHQLTGGEWNGKPTPNPCDDGEMWECPDFFALDGGHVLIYSTMGKVFWQSGALSAEMKFTPRKSGLLDLGAFYAPKTQLDAKGRRILWGWIPERRGDDAMTKAGWSGMMSLPRVMNLDQDGSLRLTMLPELEALRVPIPAGVDKGTDQTRVQVIPKACGEFLHEVAGLETDFEIVLRAVNPATELLRVKYAASARSLTVDGHEIALGAADRPRLHGYVDGSVIEIIMNGTTGYTKRFYYDQAVAPDVEIELVQPKDGRIERAQVWGIKPISPNRLTTPA